MNLRACVGVHVCPVSVNVYVCTLVSVCACLCMSVRVCLRECTCVRVSAHVCLCTCLCTCVSVFVCTCQCACVCVHVCLGVHVCVGTCVRACEQQGLDARPPLSRGGAGSRSEQVVTLPHARVPVPIPQWRLPVGARIPSLFDPCIYCKAARSQTGGEEVPIYRGARCGSHREEDAPACSSSGNKNLFKAFSTCLKIKT